ncbi:MAG: YIP1 family protein [Ideonella sp.]|nr:YIP1 family protein [Ideonella sp.]MBL0149482.1 YIP1 family protein [Ideonella sp.]
MSRPSSTVKKAGLLRTVIGVMVNPGGLLKARLADTGLMAALAVSGLAFTLFFLQTGLDRARSGQIRLESVGVLAAAGLVLGTAGVAITALVGWVGCKLLGSKAPLGEALRAFGLAYSPTLVYAVMGLAVNLLLGWNTAVAFGVTGLLWALGPMIVALKDMVDGHSGRAAAIATVCGLLVLFGWARLSVIA